MEGITSFVWDTLRAESVQLGEDGKEGQTFLAITPTKFRGEVLGITVQVPKKTRVAVKTFKKTKSVNKLYKEALHQQIAASTGAAPPIYGLHPQEKYIVMKCMHTLVVTEYKEQNMPESLQYMICALMHRLDTAKILQNDSNALNVMLDERGRPYMIDYGMAKKITPAIEKKRKGHPNISVTLWGLVRGFKRYKIGVDIMNECVNSEDPMPFIERGEEELQAFEFSGKSRGKKKRKQPGPSSKNKKLKL